jgi:hypothetical protein
VNEETGEFTRGVQGGSGFEQRGNIENKGGKYRRGAIPIEP